jgi:hypothetical protein
MVHCQHEGGEREREAKGEDKGSEREGQYALIDKRIVANFEILWASPGRVLHMATSTKGWQSQTMAKQSPYDSHEVWSSSSSPGEL